GGPPEPTFVRRRNYSTLTCVVPVLCARGRPALAATRPLPSPSPPREVTVVRAPLRALIGRVPFADPRGFIPAGPSGPNAQRPTYPPPRARTCPPSRFPTRPNA